MLGCPRSMFGESPVGITSVSAGFLWSIAMGRTASCKVTYGGCPCRRTDAPTPLAAWHEPIQGWRSSRAHVSANQKYERGSNRIGSSRLYEFAKVLDVPVSYFFDVMPSNALAGRPMSGRGRKGFGEPERRSSRRRIR